jgi:hypothetical protein
MESEEEDRSSPFFHREGLKHLYNFEQPGYFLEIFAEF